ncbi:class I SAM-dependent methyltransferase, partial [Acinetobacter baumannii]
MLAQSLQREVCGIDVNRTELVQAARVFGHELRLSFVAADIQTLALPRDVFDVILLPACVQYFADPAALIVRLLAQLREDG